MKIPKIVICLRNSKMSITFICDLLLKTRGLNKTAIYQQPLLQK